MDDAERFVTFLDNITLTRAQKSDGATKRECVCETLNRKYYSSTSGASNSFYVGSWGKLKQMFPHRLSGMTGSAVRCRVSGVPQAEGWIPDRTLLAQCLSRKTMKGTTSPFEPPLAWMAGAGAAA